MRTLLKTIYWLLIAALIAVAASASVLLRRNRQMETMIAEAAELQGLDAGLLVALVGWCSDFQPAKAAEGRYGLLALTEADGRAWATASGGAFDTFDLFDPQKNLQIGAWKFAASQRAWAGEPDPAVWALAEWRTNRAAVRAWAAAAAAGKTDPLQSIADARVRGFVADILQRSRRERFTLLLPWRT